MEAMLGWLLDMDGDRTDGCTAFAGVAISSSSAGILDGTHLSGCWWIVIGATTLHEDGLPATMGHSPSVQRQMAQTPQH